MNKKVLVAGLAVVVPLVGVLFVNLGRDSKFIKSPLIGRTAPPFQLPRLDGQGDVAYETLRGRPIVLNFWATWCVPCVQEHPYLTAAARRLKGQVEFFGVVYQDEKEAVVRHLRRYGSAYPNLTDDDGQVALAYGIYGVPETIFIDREGVVVHKENGPLNQASLAHWLQQAGVTLK